MFRWFYNFLYGSVPASFECAYSQEESVNRLSAVCTDSIFGTLARQTAYGSVKHSEVVLRRTIPFVRNSFKPVFVGKFEHMGSKTVLVGKFAMHGAVKVFLSFWFGFCILWTALVIGVSISKGLGKLWWFPFAGLGMFAAGTLLVGTGKWFARNDVAWLSNIISNALSGKTA